MIKKYLNHILSIIFFAVIFVFFSQNYLCYFSYQEQYQMFLWDSDYFVDKLFSIGGFLDYFSEFLVQYYYIPIFGCFIIALIITILQLLTHFSCKKFGYNLLLYPLTFLPSILLWYYLGDISVLINLHLSILFAILMFLLYCKNDNLIFKLAFIIVGQIAFYLLFGAGVYVLTLLIVFWEIRQKNKIFLPIIAVLVCIFSILVSYNFVQIPLKKLFHGVNYYRFPEELPFREYVVFFFFGSFAFFISKIKIGKLKFKTQNIIKYSSIALIAIFALIFVPKGYNQIYYDQIKMDFYMRIGNYNQILKHATKVVKPSPFSVCCQNFALHKLGQMGDNLFSYYQNGSEGLIPNLTLDMFQSLPVAEIFFSMGYINFAHKWYFEMNESIPNGKKSARFLKRLLQIAIINENYSLAKKYIEILDKTAFYSSFAKEQMRLIRNEKLIEQDKFYAQMRSLRLTEDFLYSGSEFDKIFGKLFLKNRNNRMAFEYLLSHALLNRNPNLFETYFKLNRIFDFSTMPKHYQEALIFNHLQKYGTIQGFNYPYDNFYLNNYINFVKTKNVALIKNTFWDYLIAVE